MSLSHMFPLDECHGMHIVPSGTLGSHALACLLSLRTLPIPITEALYERAEWADIMAKMRGMELAGILRSWPIYRTPCGCRLVAQAPRAPAGLVRDFLAVVFCPSHLPVDPLTHQPEPEVLIGYVQRRP